MTAPLILACMPLRSECEFLPRQRAQCRMWQASAWVLPHGVCLVGGLLLSLSLAPAVLRAEQSMWPQDTQDLQARVIIDSHVHAAGLGHGGSGAFINAAMRKDFRFDFFLKWMGVSLSELQTAGDALLIRRLHETLAASHWVDAAVVLAMDGVIDRQTGQLDRDKTQLYVPNDYLAEEVSRYSNLFFGASINPERKDALSRLIEACRKGAWLVKWLPPIMYIDPADERYIPFYDALAALDMPLLSHVGRESAFPHVDNSLADPRRLALPLQRGVTVIAAHIATTGRSEGQDNFARILPMFQEYPNLYADISALTMVNKRGYLVRALQLPGVTQRLIYGSDWPLQYWPLVSPWHHLRHIGFGNAWRVSRIENVWDRDVRLKQILGVPAEVFTRRLGAAAQGFATGEGSRRPRCILPQV